MTNAILTLMLGMLSLGSVAALMPAGCGRAAAVELVLEAETTAAPSDRVMDRTRAVIESRVQALGAAGASVVRQGPNRFLVGLASRADAERVKALIARPGRLELRLLDPHTAADQAPPPGSQMLPYSEGGPDARIAVQRRVLVSGRMIADARAGFDALGQPAVTIRLDETGTRRFAQVTRENVNQRFAIVLDNVVISAPVINEPILGGDAQISGSFTPETAEQLAIALRSGPLPIKLVVIEERVPAPTR